MYKLKICNFKQENICDIVAIEKTSDFSNWTEKMFFDESNNKYSNFKIGIFNDIVVGYIIYSVIFDEAEIFNIVVKKEYRNKSFGRQFLNYVIKDALNKNVKKILLEVSEKNVPALTLYKKFNFVQYGERKRYYKDGSNAFLMTKEIKKEDFLINKC